MAPKIDQGTIIIIDIGKNVAATEEKNEKPFFTSAVECAIRIIERKIMTQGKNYVGVILLGSKKTENNMAEQCDNTSFRHIQLFTELQTPTWKMIRSLPSEPSKSRGDWLEALVVAADHFQNGTSGVTISSRKIVLMTNFKTPAHIDENVDMIVNGLQEENLEVDILGVDILDENQKGEDIELARKIAEVSEGTSASFEDTMSYLLFHRKKSVNATPWNVDLSIGTDIKIPVSAYIRLKDEPVLKKWMKAIKDPVTEQASTSEAVVKTKLHVTEDQTVVDKEKIVKGYEYGQKIIPFSECDENMLYDSGEKCLTVYGFTHKTNITWQNLNGDGLYYVFGRKGDKKAQFAVQCLVECLLEKDLVGIVRRVYNKGNAPKMFALMPVIDSDNYICFSMIGVCFKDDIKNMAFPSIDLKKFQCTNKQVEGFKELIKAMDLTKAYDETYDDTEAFPIANTVSPTVQYVLDCIAYRAMNPGKPLPQPREDIMSLFKIPPLIEKRARDPLETLKSLFSLKAVEIKKRDRKRNYQQMNLGNVESDEQSNGDITSHDMPKVELPNAKKSNVTSRLIGTASPVEDYKILLDQGKTLADLSPEMTAAIESLISTNLDGSYTKAFETISFYRSECVKSGPVHYNNWLQKFKTYMVQCKKIKVIDLINEKKLNYILKNENDLSIIEKADDDESQLYECNTIPDSIELTIASEIDDMFDNM